MIDKVDYLEQQLAKTHYVTKVFENVIPKDPVASMVKHFEKRTRSTAVVIDAADDGIIGRPRLWWIQADWDQVQKLVKYHLNIDLSWQTKNGYTKLWNFTAKHLQATLKMNGGKLPDMVTRGEKLMPCLTTPESQGRPAPVGAQVSDDAWHRWKTAGQIYAPWHYEETAMITTSTGQLALPPADLKEQFHQLPIGYTSVGSPSELGQSKMLANGWHTGCARVALFLAIMGSQMYKIQGAMIESSFNQPHPFGSSRLEIMINRWTTAGIDWDQEQSLARERSQKLAT